MELKKKQTTFTIDRGLYNRKLRIELLGRGSFDCSKTDLGKWLADNLNQVRLGSKGKVKVTIIVEHE